MASPEHFWTYWLPHYVGIVWEGLFSIWLLLTPVAVLLVRWPHYAAVGRLWLGALNRLLAFGSLLWAAFNALELLFSWYAQGYFVQYVFVDRYTALHWWASWRVAFLLLASQLFWLRRWRNNRMLTVVLLLGWLGSSFVLYWQLSYNDYLPSSWPLTYWLTYFFP